jgi:tetratricopeptide (TPR) repeat protein
MTTAHRGWENESFRPVKSMHGSATGINPFVNWSQPPGPGIAAGLAPLSPPATEPSAPEREDGVGQVVEQGQRFSQSLLWTRQRHYFENRGITAWHQGAVPHYITNNPFIANAYARLVVAWVADWTRTAGPVHGDRRQPLYIIELGAGCGRFAYLFLKQLQDVGGDLSLSGLRVKYVMTNFTEGMLDCWVSHPWLRPFVANDSLDFAVVDAERDHPITLRCSAETLTRESLVNPLVVLANYFFDSVPQDVFTRREGKLYEVSVTLTAPDGEPAPSTAGVLGDIDCAYEEHAVTGDAYEREDWNQVLRTYEGRSTDASFAFPTVALQCLDRFRRLSRDRLLLLAADQGYYHEDNLPDAASPPVLMDHGSFSMYVNYHALGRSCLNQGGHVLHPARPGRWLNVSAFLFGGAAEEYRETARTYDEVVNRFGLDDFFTLKKGVEKVYAGLDLAQLLAYLRSSRWDPNILLGCTPVLQVLLPDASAAERREMRTAVARVWDHYYPIGEEADLPFSLGRLLYVIGDYDEALRYYEQSRDLYGTEVVTLYNMALCHHRLGQNALAIRTLEDLRHMAPYFENAEILRRVLQQESQEAPAEQLVRWLNGT